MDYQMFTTEGNAAVQGIINDHATKDVDHNELYDFVLTDLERLQTVTAFAEATDTAVREAVYQRCLQLRPIPVFRSVRS